MIVALVHMCKMMISPAIFFLSFDFFKIRVFQVFQSSSINAKRKFLGVPHLLHMWVILFHSTLLCSFIHFEIFKCLWYDNYLVFENFFTVLKFAILQIVVS